MAGRGMENAYNGITGGALSQAYNTSGTQGAAIAPAATPAPAARENKPDPKVSWEAEMKRVKEILASKDYNDQQKDQARMFAVSRTLDYYNEVSPFLKDSMLKTAQGQSSIPPASFNPFKGETASSQKLAEDLKTKDNYFAEGGGPSKLRTPEELKRDIKMISESTTVLRDLGIHKNNDRTSEEVRAASGIFKGQMDKMMNYSEYLKSAMPKDGKGNMLDTQDPTLNSLARGFNEGKARADFREAVDPMVSNIKNNTDHHDNSKWEGIRDGAKGAATIAAFAGGAALAGQASAASQAAKAAQVAQAGGAASTAGAASPLAVTGGGAPISGALATGGSAVGTTGGAGLGLSSGAGAALGGTAGGGAIASGAGLTGGAALGMGGAAATGLGTALSSTTPLATTPPPAATSIWSNPAVIGAGVGAVGSIAGGLIQNEALGDATAAANEQSKNAIAAAERANAQAQAIIEANRVRGVGAIEGYNQAARDTLSAGYSDISNLYRNTGTNSQNIINAGVGAARNDVTAGYSDALGATNSGINNARNDITAGSNAGIGTLRDAYGQSMANLESGYNQASQDIQRGYATGDQRLVESASQQLQSYRDMYDQSQARLNPYQQAGTTALSNIQNGVNLGDPAYQFRLKDQQEAINAQLAAQGLAGSGRATRIMGDQVSRLTADETRRQFENNMQLANMGFGATTQANQLSSAQGQNAAGVYDRTGQLRASNAVGQGMALGGLATDRTTQANNVGANYAGQISNLQAGTGQQLGGLEAQRGTQLADLYSRRGADLSTNSLYGTQQTLANSQLYNDKIAAAMSDVYGGTANLYSKTGSDVANVNMGAGTTGSQANLAMGSNIAGSYNQLGQQLPQMYAAQGMNTANALGGVTNAYTGYQNRVDQQNMYEKNMQLQNKWLQAYQGNKV